MVIVKIVVNKLEFMKLPVIFVIIFKCFKTFKLPFLIRGSNIFFIIILTCIFVSKFSFVVCTVLLEMNEIAIKIF